MYYRYPHVKKIPQKQTNHFNLKWLVFIYSFFFLSSVALAQNKTVSGTVTGNNNQPLPGVSVLVQGTTRGVSTDNAGRFTIAAATGDVLLF